MENNVKVTIVCLAYNHEHFIRDALQSFIMQQTNFCFEIIVHDDASTDKTTEIIKEYERKYPHMIKPIYQVENQWSKGKTLSKTFIYPKIRGKYVVFNEGDDYFIDENKLQKQVDFLDANLDCSICFHPVHVIWQNNCKRESIFPTSNFRFNKETLTIDHLLVRNFIQTNSCMYRWRFHQDDINVLMPDNIIPGDYFLHLLHAQVGKIGFLPDNMAVYRKHGSGIWVGAGQTDEWFVKYSFLHLNFYTEVEKKFGIDKSLQKNKMANDFFGAALRLKRFDVLEKFSKEYPLLYNDSLSLSTERLSIKNTIVSWIKMKIKAFKK